MISNDRFLDLASRHLRRDLRDPNNLAQLRCVNHTDDRILQIVAGPGSGKTTVLILRALFYVFVHDTLPENILITTFTRKAARELRTRWLDWGTMIVRELESDPNIDLDHIDLNRCRIDTLDGIIQQALTEYRPPGSLAPILAEPSASNIILKRSAFQGVYQNHKQALDSLLGRYTFDRKKPRNQGEALRETKRLLERLIQDSVDLSSYERQGQAESLIVDLLMAYRRQAVETNIFDFTLLEEQFLQRLSDGNLSEWIEGVSVVLIDEFQDTNSLQESIYFKVIQLVNPSVTIVGDDDQSMYRFRGGSVELFTDFASRCRQCTGRTIERVDMTRNFRSRPEIVHYYNRYITNDPCFLAARINPPKPLVEASRSSENIPVLGMFRADQESLATELVGFISKLIDDRRVLVGHSGREIRMSRDGELGDVVFLSHSVNEGSYDRWSHAFRRQFPGVLRDRMEACQLQVFNPRGQALRSIPDVGILLGLLLLAVDPDDTVVNDVFPTNEARFFLLQWKRTAQEFVDGNPPPNDGQALQGFICDWRKAALGRILDTFPQDWPVLELVYKLLSWIPGFQHEPENQVWLEAIMRIISSAGMASPYRMQLLQNTENENLGDHIRLSRLSMVRDALLPIAEDEVEVDEDIMPSVPRNRLQFMTIHQAKGLEFPLVIVDVGSRFNANHHTQRFLRFPKNASNVAQAEDDVESHLPASLRGNRQALDRTFDDLIRLYYVAFSRPQSVLLLVGNENCLRYGTGIDHAQNSIPNVALNWRRDGTWPWRQPYDGRRPPVRVETPFLEV